MLYDLERFFALSDDDDVDTVGCQGLIRQQRWVPAADHHEACPDTARFDSRAISTASLIIGPVTREIARHNESAISSITRFLKLGVMVESMSLTS